MFPCGCWTEGWEWCFHELKIHLKPWKSACGAPIPAPSGLQHARLKKCTGKKIIVWGIRLIFIFEEKLCGEFYSCDYFTSACIRKVFQQCQNTYKLKISIHVNELGLQFRSKFVSIERRLLFYRTLLTKALYKPPCTRIWNKIVSHKTTKQSKTFSESNNTRKHTTIFIHFLEFLSHYISDDIRALYAFDSLCHESCHEYCTLGKVKSWGNCK